MSLFRSFQFAIVIIIASAFCTAASAATSKNVAEVVDLVKIKGHRDGFGWYHLTIIRGGKEYHFTYDDGRCFGDDCGKLQDPFWGYAPHEPALRISAGLPWPQVAKLPYGVSDIGLEGNVDEGGTNPPTPMDFESKRSKSVRGVIGTKYRAYWQQKYDEAIQIALQSR